MILYGYWRSSAAYRVRIALNLKGIEYEQKSVHLLKNGGEQFTDEYTTINPSQLVPTLVDGNLTLNQSMAILDYIEQTHPEPTLLPADNAKRAQVLALANDVACDVHPLNNLRVLTYLSDHFYVNEQQKMEWYHHWLCKGFRGLETHANQYGSTGKFLFEDTLSLADVVLIPQIYNALRYKFDMKSYPRLYSIWENCNSLSAFYEARPENQPDAV